MKKFHIAKLTRYGNLAAGTRQRFDQYDRFLTKEECSTASYPLLDNSYLSRLYEERAPSFNHVAKRYLMRLHYLVRGKFDLIWVHSELFPYLPGFMERLVSLAGVPAVYDFDDAIFHNYDRHSSAIIRKTLGKKLEPLLRRSDAAFCGNSYLQDYAARFCENTCIVPTVVDTDQYRPAIPSQPRASTAKQIGWLGTPSTWNSYMVPMLPLLIEAAQQTRSEIFVVGSAQTRPQHPVLRAEPWSEAGEIGQLQSMDIGIMPLDDTPWARGKCGYKLIQYMACGLPVIASPVGVNREIVEHGINGFLAHTDEEWRWALRTLLEDANLRRRMGEAGRRKVEAHYSLQVYGPRVAAKLRQIASGAS